MFFFDPEIVQVLLLRKFIAETRTVVEQAETDDAIAKVQKTQGKVRNIQSVSYTHLDVYKRQMITVIPLSTATSAHLWAI